MFHHTRYVHLGVMRPQLMLDICRYCKENTNAIVSIDSGNLSRENTDMLLPYADIFIPDNKTVERTLPLLCGARGEDRLRYGCGARHLCL